MTITHPLAIAWLERVERLAADLPPGQRSELLVDLREHLDAALAPGADGLEVGAVLDRLGDPTDVVAAARADGDGAMVTARSEQPPSAAADVSDGLTTPEVVALAALVLAGLIGVFFWPLTILLWAIGIAIVAVSGRWRGAEVLAMVLLPIAWALPLLSMVVPMGSTMQTCVGTATGEESCTMEQSGLGGPWVLVVALVVLVLILLGTRWLARAPGGRPMRR